MDRTIFGRLRTILAELYPDMYSIRRVLYDAGINLLHVELSGIPINAWHSILDYAEKQHMIKPLLDVVRSEYGSNLRLQRISDDYLRLTNKDIEPEVEESAFKERDIIQQQHLDTEAQLLEDPKSMMILKVQDFESMEEVNECKLTVARPKVRIQCRLPISLNKGECTIEFSSPFLRNIVIVLTHDEILKHLIIGRHIPIEWNGRRFLQPLDEGGYQFTLNGLTLWLSEADAADLCDCVDFMVDAYVRMLMNTENVLEAWEYPLERTYENTYGYEIAIIPADAWERIFKLAQEKSQPTKYALYTMGSEIQVETSVITHTRLTVRSNMQWNGLASKEHVSVIYLTPEYEEDWERSIGPKGWWTVPLTRKWFLERFDSILENSSVKDNLEQENNPRGFMGFENANSFNLHVQTIHNWIMADSYGNLPTTWFLEFCEAYRLLIYNAKLDKESESWEYVLSHLPVRRDDLSMPERYNRNLSYGDIGDILTYNVDCLQKLQFINKKPLEFMFRGYEVLLREIRVDATQLAINRFKRTLWPLFERAAFERRFTRLGRER